MHLVRDPFAVGQLALEIAAHRVGEARVLDPQHDLEVDVEAAVVEVRRADVDDVVDDRELGVELGRLIFVDLDMAAEEPAVAVASGRDGRIIVRLGGVDDPRPPAPPDPSDAPDHRSRRREISEDHVEPARALHVAADAPPPAVAHAQRAAELPLQRPAPFVIFGDHALQRAELRALAASTSGTRRRNSGREHRLGPVEAKPQVAPVLRAAVVEIGRRRCSRRRSAPSARR